MEGKVSCPHCHSRVPGGKFCHRCGRSLTIELSSQPAPAQPVLVKPVPSQRALTVSWMIGIGALLVAVFFMVIFPWLIRRQQESALPTADSPLSQLPAGLEQDDEKSDLTPKGTVGYKRFVSPEGREYYQPIPDSDFIPGCSRRYISRAEIEYLSNEDLCTLRNEFFARHGYDFTGCVHLQAYFEGRLWYHPEPDNRDGAAVYTKRFNQCEKDNVNLIKQVERERGSLHLKSHLHDTSWYRPGI